jgi:molybdopterin-synthase adenylyltransferase
MTSLLDERLRRHLIRPDRQEDLCFALWRPSQGKERLTTLLVEAVLPQRDERHVHGNASFTPGYYERALAAAMQRKAGLALLHSHLTPGWQRMSRVDVAAEMNHAASTLAATGLPLLGMTVGTDGTWSARLCEKTGPREYELRWCASVRVVGAAGLSVSFADRLMPAPKFSPELARTVSAWGPVTQAKLARLRVAVVGLGSVGAPVAEALARMGVQRVTLIDFDLIKPHNLDRHLHATRRDVGLLKVDVSARRLRDAATAGSFDVASVPFGITEEDGFRAALDCDVIFSCVDRPWPRSVLNLIANAHLIPVVDGGMRLRQKPNGTMLSADWKAHVAMPGRRCLQCVGQYDPALVQVEREGRLDDPHYIASLPEGHELRANENVFPFSLGLASLELNQMLSLAVAPCDISDTGEFNYHFVTGTLDVGRGKGCGPRCPYPDMVALGDHAPYKVTSRHAAAEQCRTEATKRPPRS